MKVTNLIAKTGLVLVVFMSAAFFNKVRAQQKYGFATFDQWNEEKKAYYLVVSDPVKNWYGSMSKEEREDWERNFKTSANRQAGFELMENYQRPVPHKGEYEYFSSLSACREAIQDKINSFKKERSGTRMPVRVIYVNIRQY